MNDAIADFGLMIGVRSLSAWCKAHTENRSKIDRSVK
jgi:hypothetical protein